MAYIVSTTQTATASAATYTVTLGAHVSGDLLLVCLSQDGGGTAIAPDATTATAGWAMIGTQAASGASRQAWAWLIADSTSEVNPVFTGANDDWIGTCLVIRDAHATTPFGATPTSGTDFVRSDWNAVNTSASGSLTSAVDDCLLIYSWCADGSSIYMRCKSDEAIAASKVATAAISGIVAYRQQGAAAAAPTVTMYATIATEGGNGWVLAVRNKDGGSRSPDCRSGMDETDWGGNFAVQHSAFGVAGAPNSLLSADLDGISPSAVAITPTVGGSLPLSLWGGAPTSISSTENTAGAWVGAVKTITAKNMSGKLYYLHYVGGYTATRMGNDGIAVAFADSGGNWVAYQLATKSALAIVDERVAIIALGQADELGASAGAIDWTDITKVGYFAHRIGSSGTATAFLYKNEILCGTAVLTGGGVNSPLKPSSLTDVTSWDIYRAADLQGSAQVLGKYSVQIGDGTNATYFDAAASSFEFPLEHSVVSAVGQQEWNVNANQVALTIKASADDTIILAAGVVATDTAQALTIHADSSTDATYSFAGESMVGCDVTWKTGIPCSSATFKSGGIIDFKGADIVNVIANSGTDDALMSASDGFSATGCTFTASATAVYGIRIAAAGTFDLASTTFTDFTKDIDVTAATGTVTINLAAGQTTPTYQTAGATVTIVSSPVFQEVTITGLVAGSRVRIYDTDAVTDPELFNDIVAGTSTTWTDGTAAAADRPIRVRIANVSGATAYDFIEANIGTCGITSGTETVSYLANQSADAVYNANAVDGSAVADITFTDAATDLVNCNIAAGTVSWAQIYAAFVYWIGTATGIADDIAYVEAKDQANYLLTSMQIRNTNATPLTLTGGWGRDSTTLTIADCIDVAGSTGNIYPEPDHVVNNIVTVGGVNIITGDIADIPAAPSAAAIAAEVLNEAALTPIMADMQMVLGTQLITGSTATPSIGY